MFNAFTTLNGLPRVAASGNAAAGDLFARSYFDGLQAGFAPYSTRSVPFASGRSSASPMPAPGSAPRPSGAIRC
ncbi:hypothetical protein [Methylobacterium frigidaeris]|uniref:Uncharacterized protein n=1 Tax=Methylobacterium frigidaeris TaxID=2038277 RepID=A0AA37HFJ3_9HYPH|nr:hypothetical protein [Methylobacterium frigidaeris]PIK73938.1 hypothetical protein CS379_05415 [Methylobacterium frigidaeris]GJD65101.1 hypothetical protein MPEAHAMD_5287 [Methylobacterium frigidaeris]